MTELKPTPEKGIENRGSTGIAGWASIVGWVITIAGGIAAFAGAFILLAGKDQWIGIGGDWSWRVGDIDPLWAVGLLAAGAIALVIGVTTMVLDMRAARQPARDPALHDLEVHLTAFVLANTFLWIQDLAIGGGIEYAYWVTIPWGLGLAAHALAYYTSRHGQRPGAPQPH